jgi:hypothetical protein
MKEKEIDVCLSLASLLHLLVLGFGGAFAAELVSKYPREEVIFFGSMITIVIGLICFQLYLYLFNIVKQKKQ